MKIAAIVAALSFAVAVAIVSHSEAVRAQQQPASSTMQPRAFADRASEGAGATIFGNVCWQPVRSSRTNTA